MLDLESTVGELRKARKKVKVPPPIFPGCPYVCLTASRAAWRGVNYAPFIKALWLVTFKGLLLVPWDANDMSSALRPGQSTALCERLEVVLPVCAHAICVPS